MEKTQSHTPGPWSIGTNCNGIDIGTPWPSEIGETPPHAISRVVAHTHGNSPQDTANARLITAAPDLLDALTECVAAYEQHRDAQPTGAQWPDPNHICHARAAIAKAKAPAV